jgi:signal transduction histidine kinase
MKTNKTRFEAPELSVEELSHALYEANLKLSSANDKLKQQEQQRLEFYANISHDLRAPITAISNAVEYMLSASDLDREEIREDLTLMQKRIQYLEHLINDIFLLSSLDSSDSKVKKETVDIRFFLEDFFYLCEADARYATTVLHLELPEDFALTMQIDPVLMQRVLDNLFTNSLKYSSGTPQITLGAKLQQEHLLIYVRDQGIGIAQEHLSKIFDRSYRIQQARTPDNETGSGFGLSIVQSIVARHGGEITCQSTPGKGSTFQIILPVDEQ